MTDEQLMKLYANGKSAAFDQLYSRHRATLYRYVKRQISDVATANDLYQGVWEKIIRGRSKYKTAIPFKAWMFRIAHNHLVDHYRRQQPETVTEMEALPESAPGPQQHTLNEHQKSLLQDSIAALPAEQKESLLLQLESGLKMEDIAKLTGVSRETVKSRLRYAVNKLKRSLVE